MIEIKAYGEIKQGAFYPRNSRMYIQAMKEAGNVSECVLTITGSNKRTIDQNAYLWAILGSCALHLRMEGYAEITDGMLYRGLEERFCTQSIVNEKTGKTIDMIKPLKEQETDRFHHIVEEFRIGFMQKHDLYIETPAEWYGMTEEAYDLWKSGAINKAQAMRMK
jgi:hypothetical protein